MAVLAKKVAVVASLLKRDGIPIARDVEMSFTLPSLKRGSFQNTGDDETPLFLFDGVMEASVTGAGADLLLTSMSAPTTARYKLTNVQQTNLISGDPAAEKVEYVFKGKGTGAVVPDTKMGEAGEASYTIVLSRFEMYVNGVEAYCIDRDQDIYRVNGVDYFAAKKALLI